MVSYLIDLVSFDNSMAASRRRDGSATQVERRSDPATPASDEVIDNNPNSDYNQKISEFGLFVLKGEERWTRI